MIKRAFTLVEVIVVVACIAILAALVSPAFVSAKKSAHRTVCLSNLHQYGVAIALYRADYDGAESGTPGQMGLPPAEVLCYMPILTRLQCDGELAGPTGYHVNYPSQGTGKGSDDGASAWAAYVADVGPSAILVFDPNHNPPHQPGSNSPVTKIGLRSDGAGVVRTRAPDGRLGWYWWHE